MLGKKSTTEKRLIYPKSCQITFLNGMAEPMGLTHVLWQRRNRLKRIFKRRLNYFGNLFRKNMILDPSPSNLRPGDLVRVRSHYEIEGTLNRWNQLKGCGFMEEMWPYCGTTQKVLKRVERFLDERDYLIKKCKGIVLLENVICQGTKDFGPCDRSCFYFWREEWLEKVEPGD